MIQKIQNNWYLMQLKNAVVKVSYIHIVFSLAIIVLSKFHVNYLSIGYEVFLLFIALVFPMIMEADTFGKKMIHAFFLSIWSIVFIERIVLYPIFSLLYSPLQIKVGNILLNLKGPKINAPRAVEEYLNNVYGMILLLIFTLLLIRFSTSIVFWVLDLFIIASSGLSHIIGIIAVILAIVSFWIMGLHGVGVIGTVLRPFWFYMIIANGYAYVNGNEILYIGSEAFYSWFVWVGGSGATIGLAILIRFLSKSEHFKSLQRDVLHTSIYNINETVIFGVPIVENKQFMIPFIITPIISASIAYFSVLKGYVNIPSFVSPWVLPGPFGAFISTMFDYRSVFLYLLLVLISTIVYYPFFRRVDKLKQYS